MNLYDFFITFSFLVSLRLSFFGDEPHLKKAWSIRAEDSHNTVARSVSEAARSCFLRGFDFPLSDCALFPERTRRRLQHDNAVDHPFGSGFGLRRVAGSIATGSGVEIPLLRIFEKNDFAFLQLTETTELSMRADHDFWTSSVVT